MDYGKKASYFPLVGKKETITVTGFAKNDSDPNSPDNFKSPTKNYGYHWDITLATGEVRKCGNGSLWKAFSAANVQEGETIELDHFDRGKWKITKLDNPETPHKDWGEEE